MIFFNLGCSYELSEVEPPVDLIERDSFQLILTEIMLLEGYVKTKHSNVADFYLIMQQSAEPIFDKYNIDSSRYSRSMDYYAHHQEELIEMYKSIQDSITLWSVSGFNEKKDTLP